ncbi:hypothetical protein SAMN05216360_110210 [Methylobacterium phyllostachyos]|uniref:Uncharacterized protein n=1 Tax=Methylobacterium phyllostachyos TaxID=582672 RepID=A0A1H0DLB4_9HYPH|nr:hypothetical protein [Methylobacterium phyllostachyos]SDN70858.1 hypothetical protein SAMN05216360_110210 [Methylobacterium phyllostachyos]
MIDPRSETISTTTNLFLDNRTCVLFEVFKKASAIWDKHADELRELKDFHFYQKNFLTHRLSEIKEHEFWQCYAASIDFEEFEAMLTFAKRVLFTHSKFEEIVYLELVRSEHYRIKAEFDAYRLSLPDGEMIPNW